MMLLVVVQPTSYRIRAFSASGVWNGVGLTGMSCTQQNVSYSLLTDACHPSNPIPERLEEAEKTEE